MWPLERIENVNLAAARQLVKELYLVLRLLHDANWHIRPAE